MPVCQSTHWYYTGYGFTSNPVFAVEGEIERVGLHDCSNYSCEEEHAHSAQWYYRELLQAAEFASDPEGYIGTAKLWTNTERQAYSRALLRAQTKGCVVYS